MQEATAASAPLQCRLPIDLISHPPPRASCFARCVPRGDTGVCLQGNDEADTHKDELRFAYDFALPVGTPVLAVAEGVVVAAVEGFRGGSRSSKENRARANFVAIRHDDGLYSRYYHLCHRGVCVAVGERVTAGQVVGRSGNTGFSGAPHLHFDVVDVLPLETATLALVGAVGSDVRAHRRPLRSAPPMRDEVPLEVECVAGSFSGALPPLDAPLVGPAVWADPPTANAPLRNPSDQTRGAVVLIERCAHVDFLDKAERAAAAGAAAVVVVNYARASSDELITMGMPIAARNARRRVAIPALFVSSVVGAAVRAALTAAPPQQPPTLVVGRAACFTARSERVDTASAAAAPADDATPSSAARSLVVGDGAAAAVAVALPTTASTASSHTAHMMETTSDFVPLTVPVRFLWPEHPLGYRPLSGARPPREVMHAPDDTAPLPASPPSRRTTTVEETTGGARHAHSRGGRPGAPGSGLGLLSRAAPAGVTLELRTERCG